jgi:hypothetical protein
MQPLQSSQQQIEVYKNYLQAEKEISSWLLRFYFIEIPPASRPKPELAAQLESDIVKDGTRIPGIPAPDNAAAPPLT